MGKRKIYRGKNRKRERKIQLIIRIGCATLIIVALVIGVLKIVKPLFFESNEYRERDSSKIDAAMPDMDVQLLTTNSYSRPGKQTEKIKGIVMHYTANPGATAIQNRNYFEGLKDSQLTKASSHFIVGLEGEIVQCVPTWEVAYASNDRNNDTVSIECCHPGEDGTFNKKTYQSMVDLVAWLCLKFDLDEKDVIRHYDVTQKSCPKYFVENESSWKEFRADVKAKIRKLK